jgi:acyl-CoA thioesterase-1
MKKNPSILAATMTALCSFSVCCARGQCAVQSDYLAPVAALMEVKWPKNRAVTIVCHGHSVPAGYFKTPAIDSLNAYPHLLRVELAERFPHAVINVIVTAIGGEDTGTGSARFDQDVLALKPDVIILDYALNDRRIGLENARKNWVAMIEKAAKAGSKVILLTPTPDQGAKLDDPQDPLNLHAEQIRKLAAEHRLGLVDSLAAFKRETVNGVHLTDLMSHSNHPNARGHSLIAEELFRWFPGNSGSAPVPNH